MSEWKPIAWAPKDGTKVLLFFQPRRLCIGRFVHDQSFMNGELVRDSARWVVETGLFISIAGEEPPVPTHWMTLPDPPGVSQ